MKPSSRSLSPPLLLLCLSSLLCLAPQHAQAATCQELCDSFWCPGTISIGAGKWAWFSPSAGQAPFTLSYRVAVTDTSKTFPSSFQIHVVSASDYEKAKSGSTYSYYSSPSVTSKSTCASYSSFTGPSTEKLYLGVKCTNMFDTCPIRYSTTWTYTSSSSSSGGSSSGGSSSGGSSSGGGSTDTGSDSSSGSSVVNPDSSTTNSNTTYCRDKIDKCETVTCAGKNVATNTCTDAGGIKIDQCSCVSVTVKAAPKPTPVPGSAHQVGVSFGLLGGLALVVSAFHTFF
eukprot:GILJ01007550.1.p1 GENE.GILJ01007550.1~~GILJ01007550.1.p1  ORF type:complete len:286 (+),score=32.28 GILJ01007550.1:403-1260(+)